MDQDIRFAHLVKCGFERIHQMGGKFADETDRIGQQERKILDHDFPYRGIKRGEEFVFGKDLAFAQQIHKRGFPDIGVSHKSCPGEFASVFALHGLLFVDVYKFIL